MKKILPSVLLAPFLILMKRFVRQTTIRTSLFHFSGISPLPLIPSVTFPPFSSLCMRFLWAIVCGRRLFPQRRSGAGIFLGTASSLSTLRYYIHAAKRGWSRARQLSVQPARLTHNKKPPYIPPGYLLFTGVSHNTASFLFLPS